MRAPRKGYFCHQCEYIVWGTRGPSHAATHSGPFPGCIFAPVLRVQRIVIPREKNSGRRLAIVPLFEDVFRRLAKKPVHKDALLPAQGIHVNPGSPGINDREPKPGEISKHDFRLPPIATGQLARTVSFDSAEYIGKVHDALSAALGTKGTLTLFDELPHVHRCFADQVCAEYPTWVEAKSRRKRIWTLKPGGPDNDYLDSLKLATLAAYTLGMEPSYLPPKQPKSTTKRNPNYGVI